MQPTACHAHTKQPVLAGPAHAGSAYNNDGRSSSLTAPNGPAQTALLRAALASCGGGAAAADVAALSLHGTGTPLGDPIEISALAAGLGGPRDGLASPAPIQFGAWDARRTGPAFWACAGCRVGTGRHGRPPRPTRLRSVCQGQAGTHGERGRAARRRGCRRLPAASRRAGHAAREDPEPLRGIRAGVPRRRRSSARRSQGEPAGPACLAVPLRHADGKRMGFFAWRWQSWAGAPVLNGELGRGGVIAVPQPRLSQAGAPASGMQPATLAGCSSFGMSGVNASGLFRSPELWLGSSAADPAAWQDMRCCWQRTEAWPVPAAHAVLRACVPGGGKGRPSTIRCGGVAAGCPCNVPRA